MPSSKAAVFINGIPVVTMIAAWVFLGEKLNIIQIIGGTIVLFAVWFTLTFGKIKTIHLDLSKK